MSRRVRPGKSGGIRAGALCLGTWGESSDAETAYQSELTCSK